MEPISIGTIDQIEQLLVKLLLELPPEARPFISSTAIAASRTMDLWVPLALVALVGLVLGSISLYFEAIH